MTIFAILVSFCGICCKECYIWRGVEEPVKKMTLLYMCFLMSLLSELWSSQLWTQFKQLRIEAWKSQDFNGVWTRDLAMIIAHLISTPQFNIWNISYITSQCHCSFNSRTFASFSVTGVPRVASTVVWVNSIGALRVHVTGGRRRGAFVNILSKNKYCFF